MAKVAVKAFLCQKDGGIRTCKDRMKMDLCTGRFAVADGVSNSYHPEITAEILCEDFVASDYEYDVWLQAFKDTGHAALYEKWKERTDAYFAELSGRKLKHEQYRKEDYPVGASTLLGISINLSTRELSYDILGDSTLFVVDGDKKVQLFSTNLTEEKEGVEYLIYDNYPSCILANQQVVGEWISNKMALVPGYIILATDGVAQWIQDQCIGNLDTFDQLWKLESHEEFVQWVEQCRQSGDMDDDITLLMLKIDDVETDGFEPLHIDNLESLYQIEVQQTQKDSGEMVGLEENSSVTDSDAASAQSLDSSSAENEDLAGNDQETASTSQNTDNESETNEIHEQHKDASSLTSEKTVDAQEQSIREIFVILLRAIYKKIFFWRR